MAFSPRGFDGAAFQFNEDSWAKYQQRAMEAGYRNVVYSGGDVSPGTGRTVNVSPMDAIVPGVWFTSDATSAVTLDANPGTNRRIDYIVIEVNWATNTVTPTFVKGVPATTPQAPSLTQNAGVLWHLPLARVTLAAGATTIPAGSVEPCKPLQRKMIPYSGTLATPNTVAVANTDGKNLSTVAINDPGWAYYLDVVAQIRVSSSANGYAALRVMVDGTNTIGRGTSDLIRSTDGDLTLSGFGISQSMTGAHSVVLNLLPGSNTATGAVFTFPGTVIDRFLIRQFPA